MSAKTLSPEMAAVLAAASSLAATVATTANGNPAISGAVALAVALMNSIVAKPDEYTMADFEAAVAADDLMAAAQAAASVEARKHDDAAGKS